MENYCVSCKKNTEKKFLVLGNLNKTDSCCCQVVLLLVRQNQGSFKMKNSFK